ncbi:helix-turn-helix transcriptional regulator [Acidobacteria bacterium AH-259-D05]|nr:helix-turn-helix transcriptional regulator [Acidobacteria bacterium AH-259-D05]
MASKLRNYLRMFRKRMGLSQDEIAFLLGSENGANVSRYESDTNQPGLKVTLAYEVIFGVQARRLFAGLVQEVEQETKHRVRLLVQKLGKQKQDKMTAHKLAMLKTLTSEPGTEPGEDNETYF